MPERGQISLDHLHTLILKGIKAARGEYQRMAGEFTRDFPEYMVTTHVARQLHKKYGDGTVTMETVSDKVLTRRSGRPHTESKKKRYDIVLQRKDGSARAAIEIKNQQANQNLIIADLKRVFAALEAGKYLQVGAIAYCYDPVSYAEKRESIKTRREKAIQYRDSIVKKAKSHVRGTGYTIKEHSYIPHGKETWVGGCLIIRHKPGTKKNRAAK